MVDVPAALPQLSRMLLGDKSFVEVLHEVCRLAVAILPGVDQVSITLLEEDHTQTAVFSGALAATLDERQYGDGFGPCLTAAQGGAAVRVDDTTSDALHPDFAAVAARQGVTSVLALALPMPARLGGALTLYRLHGTQPFDAPTQTTAAEFGAYAAVVLANAALLANHERLAARLEAAMASRSVIDQAKGVIMSLTACDADEAFRTLANRSQHANRKVRDIAAEVVAAATRGERAPDPLSSRHLQGASPS